MTIIHTDMDEYLHTNIPKIKPQWKPQQLVYTHIRACTHIQTYHRVGRHGRHKIVLRFTEFWVIRMSIGVTKERRKSREIWMLFSER